MTEIAGEDTGKRKRKRDNTRSHRGLTHRGSRTRRDTAQCVAVIDQKVGFHTSVHVRRGNRNQKSG